MIVINIGWRIDATKQNKVGGHVELSAGIGEEKSSVELDDFRAVGWRCISWITSRLRIEEHDIRTSTSSRWSGGAFSRY
jgi:hypothetical protein